VITHGHADHARAGHGAVLATAATLDIMAERYGLAFAESRQAAAYGEAVDRDGVQVTLVPAGHVLGSAQVVVHWRGLTMVVSGDYKRRRDPTCPAFEPTPCDVFISEATFGLPVFRHPDDRHEIGRLLRSVAQFPERAHLVGAYALGKAQRLIALLREAGWERPIYVHGALERLNALYQRHGVDLGPLEPATTTARQDFAGDHLTALRSDDLRHAGHGGGGAEEDDVLAVGGFGRRPLDGVAAGERLRLAADGADAPQVAAVNVVLIGGVHQRLLVGAEGDVLDVE
jgi:putative mRNA 3-end processing factor